MKKQTRDCIYKYSSQIATLNNVNNIAERFNLEPSIQQKLEQRIQESSDFLKSINIVGVNEQTGEKIGLGAIAPIASRTNTNNNERKTRDITGLNKLNRYSCIQTNFDTHLKYSKLDVWAKFTDFQLKIRDTIIEQQARDRIMIGWNGTSAAAESDYETNQLLQDINIGWLENIRQNAPAQVLPAPKIGINGDYKSIDTLAYDAKRLLNEWLRNDTGLVAIVSASLLHDKYLAIIGQEQPTEIIASEVIAGRKTIGGMPAIVVPFFPENTVLITRLDNLSLYYQIGARRRAFIDNPKRDQYENFESSNEAYVIENFEGVALIENIEIVQ